MKKFVRRRGSVAGRYNVSEYKLYRPHYCLMELLWRFHKTDADDQISIPHGDSINGDKKYQLNPYTGEVLHKKTVVGKLTKKEHKRLWADKKFVDFTTEARAVYHEKYPDRPLPALQVVMIQRHRHIRAFSFKRKAVLSYKSARKENMSMQEYEVTLLAEIQK